MNKKTKKYLIYVCIAVLSVILIVLSISAAYTNINKVKRVISTQSGGGTAFSSNYLNLINQNINNYDLKRISFSSSENSKTFDVTISNFVYNNPSIINEYDIKYTLTLTLVDSNNNTVTTKDEGVSVQVGNETKNFENGVCTISDQTLTGKQSSTLTYKLTVPKDFINNVNIEAEAIPDQEFYKYTDQKKLARIFTFSEYNERTTTWAGYFSETDTSGYDGFNYILTGQGKGTITLIWDSTQLEINKVFLDSLTYTESIGTGGEKQIVFDVDSNTKSQYNIQFYKTENGTYTDMVTLKNYVQYKFKETIDTPTTE